MSGHDHNSRITDLWHREKCLRRPGELRYLRGEILQELRDRYSERERDSGGQSAEVRGHGTFERECIARGLKPRTVRDLISDYEIMRGRDVCASTSADDKEIHPNFRMNASRTTSAEKRRAARARRPKRPKHDGWSEDIGGFAPIDASLAAFARLLTPQIAKDVYRKLAALLHPDHGGDLAAMQELNQLWAVLEMFYASKGRPSMQSGTPTKESTIQ